MEINNLSNLLSLAVLVATYFIIKPLQVSIDGLQRTMKTLTDKVDNLISNNTETQAHIAEVEQISKNAHTRLNEFTDRLRDVEQRCINCTCRKV